MSYHSHADLGGQAGFGAVLPESDEPLFHAHWEAKALALTLAVGATGSWTLDASLSARETLPGYLQLSYYQIWLDALERLMIQRGMLSAEELAQGKMLVPPKPVARVLAKADVKAALAKGSSTERAKPIPARFQVGDRVRTLDNAPAHHSRLPNYARGCCGVIERVHGAHVFPDSNAQGLGANPQWLYSVVFSDQELWPEGEAQGLTVALDLWEPYLELP